MDDVFWRAVDLGLRPRVPPGTVGQLLDRGVVSLRNELYKNRSSRKTDSQ